MDDFKVGEIFERTKNHPGLKQYPKGYRGEVKETYASWITCDKGVSHGIDSIKHVESTKEKTKVNSKSYTLKTQHMAKFSLEEVEISREHPYALIVARGKRGTSYGIYVHSTLVMKAQILGLHIPEAYHQCTRQHPYYLILRSEVGTYLKMLEDIVKAPWNKDDECTITVNLYSSEK